MIRLYGISIGNGSFARVTAGLRSSLEELGLLAGFVPVDAYDDEDIYPGHDAPVGVFVGPPHGAGVMTGIGWHKKRLAFVVPNSSWIPESLVQFMERNVTHLLAPSAWAADVLRRHTTMNVSIWQHGVSSSFAPNKMEHERLRASRIFGSFEVTHCSSTTMQRKGTRELLKAWVEGVLSNELGHEPTLRMVVDAPQGYYQSELEALSRGDPRVQNSIVWLAPMNMDAAYASAFYRKHHLVIQPSRGEGFGLVGLESRASGVVVAMTRVTGHQEQYDVEKDHGVVLVRSGDDAPIDDGPSAMAPEVTSRHVLESLIEAYRSWQTYAWHAQEDAERVRKQWSWLRTTKDWIEHGGVL